MNRTVHELADELGCRVVGNGNSRVSGIASIQSASPTDIVFADDEKTLAEAERSIAGGIITGEFATASSKPLLIARQPRLMFARAAQLLMRGPQLRAEVHRTADVDDSAQVGEQVSIGPYAVIGGDVAIGSKTRIGAGSSIGAGVLIGQDCNLAANVTIYPGVRLGNRVIVHAGAVLGSDGFGYVRDEESGRYEKFPQIGRLEIGDDVEIGANSTIDRGALDLTRIGRGTKIDNLVHVGHNVQIGEDVVIAAQTGLSGSAVLEDGVIVAGQVGIADHVRIESGAILGAQCGVPTKKVIRGKGVVFWGTPARPIREYLKELAVLAKLAKK
jgi:UDP-3-O-[3-hydroxymyristoyl] glucosamine N-acyltransferase